MTPCTDIIMLVRITRLHDRGTCLHPFVSSTCLSLMYVDILMWNAVQLRTMDDVLWNFNYLSTYWNRGLMMLNYHPVQFWSGLKPPTQRLRMWQNADLSRLRHCDRSVWYNGGLTISKIEDCGRKLLPERTNYCLAQKSSNFWKVGANHVS